MEKKILNPEQQKAITHGDGPLLIIAGAGTGKTTVITERIKYLIEKKGVNPQEILALTFTEKAAQEMQNRIDESLSYGYSQLWLMTFHSFCDQILRDEAINIGLSPSFDLLTEAESLLFLRNHIFDLNLNYFRPLGNPTKFLQGLLAHFSRLRDDDISPDDYIKFAKSLPDTDDIEKTEKEKTQELAGAFKKYEELKAKKNVMDFSDLITNSLKLFRTRPNILKNYQEKFSYILVDEFQDTNYAQNELAIMLTGDKKNITVVGDDDQSIYRFRGAAIANMVRFKDLFPKAKVISLNKNYRSTQNILDFSYNLIQKNNPYRLEIEAKIVKKLVSERKIKGGDPELIYEKTGEDEAESVAKKIKEEVSKNKRAYSDFAILVRANDHAVPFQKALERGKIPYQFLGPGRLFQQEEIKDLISYLRVLANNEDTPSLYRVITNPIFNLEARDIAAMMASVKNKNRTLFEVMENTDDINCDDEAKEKIDRLSKMIKTHLELVPKETAGQILYNYFEDSGLLGYYLDPNSEKTAREAQNIAKFFQKIQAYSASNSEESVFNIVDWIDLSMQLGESPLAAEIDWSENNAVNILTVHSSKGLEFPVVFVVNLVTQRFPGRDRKEQIPIPRELIKENLPQGDENLQEERRLFYVAMTRAKDKLFLSAARQYGDGKTERKISPFVIDALGELVLKEIEKKRQTIPAEQLSLLQTFAPIVSKQNKTDVDTSGLPERQKIDFISYSQLQTFEICPLHYKLRYIMKLPPTPSPALSFGMTMHSAIRSLYQQGFGKKKIDKEITEKIINDSWIREGYESKQHEISRKKSAIDLLGNYIDNNRTESHLPFANEYPFKFFLNGIKIVGRFDRIDKIDENKIEIIDYKTGENLPDKKKLDNDLQLTIYALAASEIKDFVFNKKPEEIVLTLYYIEKNKRLTTSRSKEQLEFAKKELLQKIDSIEKSNFTCSRSILCQNCEYKILCNGGNR